ncbi:MAG TPA: class I SAM-dependent methyltransferase [Tepidisphaeraceae bacterium]|jgi:SAM-dependent methyltransferase|nr:class I SAM-dependent methyltransferase [Tepidisphaeraceae bacterium]
MELPRTNMVHRAAETWRPPLLSPGDSAFAKFSAAVRRFLDFQAGSIWRDMAAILPRATGRLLDVGCGAQPYRLLLPKSVEYLGIDTADAQSHFGYAQPDTRYFAADGPWPVASGEIDVCLATETMEHVPDPAEFLREAARCVKPKGMLILTVPFAARWHFIPHDYWRYTPASLARLLGNAGFENIRVYARGNAVTVACYKSMAIILSLILSPAPIAVRFFRLVLGLVLAPGAVPLCVLANLSLFGRGGDDCLGYTVLADRGLAL